MKTKIKLSNILMDYKLNHLTLEEAENKILLLFSVSGSLPLLDNILKEEMSAEMRTWLMELRLLIGNDR